MAAHCTLPGAIPADPLLCSIPLLCQEEFHPLGFPARVASNSEAVLGAARESWAGIPRQFDEAALEVCCLVSGGGSAELPPPPVVRARHNLLLSVADRDNAITCDLEAGRASIWVTETVAESTSFFRYSFLEAAVYCLLDTRHVVSIHAACVSHEGRGVLLGGDSGAGKTSLAYACARRGWTYTSDDATYLVRRGAGRSVLGYPRVFRFRESAGRIFPEFRGWRKTRRGNGKPTIEVQTRGMPEVRTAWECQIDHIVFLNRGAATQPGVDLEPIPPEEALRRLWWNPWPAELRVEDERRAAVRRLSTATAFEMKYRDLDAAVDKLELLARGGSQ